MNVRKPVDYSTMYRELTAILAQNLPQMDEVYAIGKAISQRPEKGAAVAAAEFLQAKFPDRTGFSPRNVRRMRDFYKTYENDQALLQLAMKIGWTLNVLIMEAKLSRLQKRFYHSFTEAYSQLKEKKGCKGIGRFLWLKAFEEADVDSVYYENGQWWHRAFKFTLNGVNPEQNCTLIDAKDVTQKTTVSLKAFKYEYRNAVPYALESLARKLIEHCLPYFITGTAPQIILKDNRGSEYHLNEYYALRNITFIAASFPPTQGKKKDKRKRVFLFGTQSA